MRLTEINENLNEILKEIELECSDFISVLSKFQNVKLFRGIKGESRDIFIDAPRSDRRSLSTPQFISNMIDAWLRWPANFNISRFCTYITDF